MGPRFAIRLTSGNDKKARDNSKSRCGTILEADILLSLVASHTSLPFVSAIRSPARTCRV